ncbi:MAG: glycosyltransferase family 4 protein [bacterium]
MQIKRILYIITQSEWGGAQKYVFDLAKSYLEQGLEVGVAAGTDKGDLFNNLSALESDKLTLFREKYLVRNISPYYDFLEFLRLIKIIWKFKPDIVHLNSSKAGILGTFAGWTCNFLKNPPIPLLKSGRFKVVYTAHGFVFNENLSILIYLFYLWTEKICSFFRDKIITVSYYDFKSAIGKKVIKKNKMEVIHNGIDLEKGSQLLSKVEARGKLKEIAVERFAGSLGGELIESPDAKIIGTVANLYENKGLKYLIEAAAMVLKDMPNCVFILIGSGEQENKLKKLIYDYKLQNNFFMLGQVKAAYQYLKGFDIFCLPSIKEGLPYCLLEALMAGLPIVATNAGGNPEIVRDGDNGFLMDAKDAEKIAEKLKILLKDDALMIKMGKISYGLAGDFSLEKMVEKTMGVYNNSPNSSNF